MTKTDAWIKAFRLRTLALSFSVVLMGSALAFQFDSFRAGVMILTLLTTLFLQILSNLSNDYGDAVSGADDQGRVGPSRMVQSGRITPNEMKRMMVVFSILAFVSGVVLLFVALQTVMSFRFLLFLLLGIGAIAAAIKYTVGVKPYGYMGLGDFFVLLFFGWVGVLGTFFLHTGTMEWMVALPATAIGLLSVGVLNMNNMRDEESDRRTGKITLIVKNGQTWGRRYHSFLIVGAVLCVLLYNLMSDTSWNHWLFLLVVPLLAKHLHSVFVTQERRELDPQLKKLSISTLLLVVVYFIGLLV